MFEIYFDQVLTSWGDRMWTFIVGLYLPGLFTNNLLYNAIYGLAINLAIVLGGPIIGNWVDRTSRLTAATISILLQNGCVLLCAVVLLIMIVLEEDGTSTVDGNLRIFMFILVVLFAAMAELASLATRISIEKDWIVVLADGDENKLSNMNSVMRTIDLATLVLAPALAGQVMCLKARYAGAVLVACWNITSAALEVFLLYRIFKKQPNLGKKALESGMQDLQSSGDFNQDNSVALLDEDGEVSPIKILKNSSSGPVKQKKWFCDLSGKLEEFGSSWREYFIHPLRNAGIGLALLYMTVLGFDHITNGYMVNQSLSTSIIGGVTAVGGLSGILGSLSFPWLRNKMGKCASGIFGFGFQTSMLLLCVISVLVVGSPFVAEALWEPSLVKPNNRTEPAECYGSMSTSGESVKPSIVLFILGLVLSRYGLWVADLTVTQLFQELVVEEKRGVLNGVQGSLNQFFEMLKFVVVIALPNDETFGYLIWMSWLFVFGGWMCFVSFSVSKHRSHKKVIDGTLSN